MSDRTTYHVNHVNGRWQGKIENAARASFTAETKDEAIATAVELAKHNMPSSVRIHKLDGTFEDERTFQDDPFPPRG